MKKHYFLVVIISLFTVALALTPLWYAYSRVPEGYSMAGIGRDDEYGLFTWAKQAQLGDWLFWNPYSLEAGEKNLFNPLFFLLGKLSTVLGNNLVLSFNLARVGLGLIFLLTTYWFFGNFFKEERERLGAFLLVCFSSGLGWLLVFFPGVSFFFSAVSSTEALSFPSLLFYPHFTAALVLLMVCFVFYLKFVQSGNWRFWLVSILAGSLLIATHAHESLILGLAPVVYLFLSQKARFRQWLRTFFYWTGLVPAGLYFGLLSQLDPVYKEFTRTPMAPLSWLDFIGAYGLILPLAAWGAFIILTSLKPSKSRTEFSFVLAWVFTVLGLLLVPFAFQRKMVMGLHLPLAVLAVLGLRPLWMRFRKQKLAWLVFALLLMVLVPQNLYFIKGVAGEIRSEPELYRLSEDRLSALAWLEENVFEESVILSNPAAGLLIPAYTGRKVVLGHWGNTNFAEEKAKEVYRFFEPVTSSADRKAIIEKYGVGYYWQDLEGISYNRWIFTVERERGKKIIELEKEFAPESEDRLKLVFENEAAKIYKIRD